MYKSLFISLSLLSSALIHADDNSCDTNKFAETLHNQNSYFSTFCLPPAMEGINRSLQTPTPEQEAERQAAWERACLSNNPFTHPKLNMPIFINKNPQLLLPIIIKITDIHAWNKFIGTTDAPVNAEDGYVSARVSCSKLPAICNQSFVTKVLIVSFPIIIDTGSNTCSLK